MVSVGASNVEHRDWEPVKAKAECALAAHRPVDLPAESGDEGKPVQNGASGLGSLPSMQFGVTGKGRGGNSAGMLEMEPPRSTVGKQPKRSEGVMPGESEKKTMGPVGNLKDDDDKSGDSLQRALEGEMVDLLRQQNSVLLEEVANLRLLLEKSAAKADSGVSSSPWSQLGDTASGHSNGTGGKTQKNDRQGRSGSRTPRARVRETALSPEKGGRKDPSKYTLNGTRVPDGPPPENHEDPPVPPHLCLFWKMQSMWGMINFNNSVLSVGFKMMLWICMTLVSPSPKPRMGTPSGGRWMKGMKFSRHGRPNKCGLK